MDIFPEIFYNGYGRMKHYHIKKRKGKTMEKFFKLEENGTKVSTEVMAGLTTFFTMAYIIAVC